MSNAQYAMAIQRGLGNHLLDQATMSKFQSELGQQRRCLVLPHICWEVGYYFIHYWLVTGLAFLGPLLTPVSHKLFQSSMNFFKVSPTGTGTHNFNL